MIPSERRRRRLVVILSTLAISALHYVTPPPAVPWHMVFLRFYCFPIIFAGVEFGWRGGLFTAAISGFVCYLPHFLVWSHNPQVRQL